MYEKNIKVTAVQNSSIDVCNPLPRLILLLTKTTFFRLLLLTHPYKRWVRVHLAIILTENNMRSTNKTISLLGGKVGSPREIQADVRKTAH